MERIVIDKWLELFIIACQNGDGKYKWLFDVKQRNWKKKKLNRFEFPLF